MPANPEPARLTESGRVGRRSRKSTAHTPGRWPGGAAPAIRVAGRRGGGLTTRQGLQVGGIHKLSPGQGRSYSPWSSLKLKSKY